MSKDLMRKYTLEAPDPKQYEHLTQKERMLAGYPYHPGDPELHEERTKARKLIKKFNDSDDRKTRDAVLDELLNPACRGNGVFIEPPFRVDYGSNITVGKNFEANFNCVFLDCAPINIGDNVMLAPNVQIYAATHPLNPKYRSESGDYFELAYPVNIGNKVWIGGNVVICPGVTIGDNSVIGAGSVVTKDVPANVVVAGNPAKIIRTMDFKD